MSIITIIVIVLHVLGGIELAYSSYICAYAAGDPKAERIAIAIVCYLCWPIVLTAVYVVRVAEHIKSKKG